MFDSAIVMGIPLVLVVIALVELIKKLGITGNLNIVISVAIGLILGIGYQYTLAPLIGFTMWFNAAIYGLALGLTAAGLFSATKSIVSS